MKKITYRLFGADRLRWLFCHGAPLLLLLLICLTASGCATANGNRTGSSMRAEANRLPFPGAQPRPSAKNDRSKNKISPTVVSYPNYQDPLIGMNRAIFAFNDVIYRFALIPLAGGYTWIAPDPVQRSVSNFFYNIKTPIYAVNHLLQLRPKKSGHNLLRFGVNTTVGIAGLFDPAQAWLGWDREETNLSDTLSGYGMGYGIYLVLPFMGPSDVRNGMSKIGDYFLNPIIYLSENPATAAIQGFDRLQSFAPNADQYNVLRRKAQDPYIFFRNMYLQGIQRDADY